MNFTQIPFYFALRIAIFVLLAITNPLIAASLDGEWRTTFGVVTLKQSGNSISGTYGDAGQFTLNGKIAGRKITFDYQEGDARGDGHWTFDDAGTSFHGDFKLRNGGGGSWEGWRPDPLATKSKTGNLAGLWLTDLGLMEIEQTGEQIKGRYAVRGGSDIEGKVTGRHVEFTTKSFRPGKGWFDIAGDGNTFTGAANTDGFAAWFGWKGRRAPEFVRHAKLVPGKIVDGSTQNLLTYCVRAPESYREKDGKKWPAILILHGSNMNARAYVNTIAAAWPDLARDYILVGINGEQPSNLGGGKSEAAFNFTYINYVGRSTFKGFPGTDRESPALVAEAMRELRETYGIARYYVGGHSQGGFLTYSLLMNFPEEIAGAFPISAGVIFQCEPGAFADEKVKAAQRKVPLAIVHSKQDPVVEFGAGEYAATLFGESHWPAFRFVVETRGAGHRFALLPVKEAIRWLELMSSDDPQKLVDFAEQRMKEKAYRDAIAATKRAATLPGNEKLKDRVSRLQKEIDIKAAAGAGKFLPQIREGKPAKTWIDDFLTYRDDFEFSPAAAEVMGAFNTLRAEQEKPAQKLMSEARAAFQQNQRDDGYAKYQEIVEKYPAATIYRNVKRWLAERK